MPLVLAVGGGCVSLFGLDYELTLADGGVDSSGAMATLPVDSSGACPPGYKRCGDRCASVEDPRFGCAAAACVPCAPEHATALCTAGACGLAACDRGYGDCDGKAETGCEVDLSREHDRCGSCTTACAPEQVCSRATCASSCDDGLANCGGSCVALATDTAHCGRCERRCPAVEHGTATCAVGACGARCDEGYLPSGSLCLSATKCLRDGDGDTFGDPTVTITAPGTCPQGYTARTAPVDCDDASADAFPGQTKYFAAPHGSPPSFDYDCDGSLAKDVVVSEPDIWSGRGCGPLSLTTSCSAHGPTRCRCALQVTSTACGTSGVGPACLYTDSSMTACAQSTGALTTGYSVVCR